MRTLLLLFSALLLAPAGLPVQAQSIAIEPQFQSAGHFHEGIAPVQLNGKWGFIDRKGNWIVKPRYEGFLPGSFGRFAVKENGRWGFIDTGGTVQIEIKYENVSPFIDGVAAAKLDRNWGFITPHGAVETPFVFKQLGRREGRVFPAKLRADSPWRIMKAISGKQAEVNWKGEFGPSDDRPIPSVEAFDTVSEKWISATVVHGFSEGVSVSRFGPGETLVDDFGDEIDGLRSEGFFRSIRRRSEGWAAATKNGQTWGYIKENGEFWNPEIFSAALEFSLGVAPVRLKGVWGYVNKEGEYALEPQYSRVYPFYQKHATIRDGDLRGFLKMDNGKISVFVPPRFTDVLRFQNGLAPIKVNGFWGYLSNDEEVERGIVREIIDIIPE